MPELPDTARVDPPRDDLTRSASFELVRAADDADGLTLTGYAAVFNEWTKINSWEGNFKERIAPGAFKKTISESGGRVRLQFDHGQHPLIGSLPIGTITKLREDPNGLFVEARLADNWLVQPVRDAIASGSVDGMSFRFSVVQEDWKGLDERDGTPERTIKEVRLMELGPVVFPAYAGTSVGVRSRQLASDLLSADDETRREVARLITEGATPTIDTPAPAEDELEPVDEATRNLEPPADGTPSYTPATRTPTSPERLAAQRGRFDALLARIDTRSAD